MKRKWRKEKREGEKGGRERWRSGWRRMEESEGKMKRN